MAQLTGSKNRRKKVRSFLESTFPACPRNCIEVDVQSLKTFLAADGDQAAHGILNMAIEFKEFGAADAAKWKCWSCVYCDRVFQEPGSHRKHVMIDHLGSEDVLDFLRGFDVGFPQAWSDKLVDTRWTPVDTESWDESGDAERKTLLESVGELFLKLMQRGILHTSHLDAMLDYAVGALKSVLPSDVMKTNGVDGNSTTCFRCLDVAQLNHVRGFLSKLSDERKSDLDTVLSTDDDAFLAPPDDGIRVVLDRERSTIVIRADQWIRPHDSTMDAAAVVSWLYGESPIVQSWFKMQGARNKRCAELHEKARSILSKIRERQAIDEHLMRYKDALQKMEVMRSSEGREAEITTEGLGELLLGWEEYLSEKDIENYTNALDMILTGCGDDDVEMDALAIGKKIINREFHVNAAEVMQRVKDLSRIDEALAMIAGFDFLAVVMPIVKRFLRDKWESESKQLKGGKKPSS